MKTENKVSSIITLLKQKTRGESLLYPLIVVALLFLPLLIKSPYIMHVLVMTGMYVILAVSYNLVSGYVGALSLSHQAFFGVGAYVSTLLVMDVKLPYLPSMILAGIIPSILAVLIAYPTLRFSYHAYAMGTLSFSIIMWLIITNWVDLTRGPMGIPGIPRPSFGQFQIRSLPSFYYYILFLDLVTLSFIYVLMKSRVGRAIIAVRENEVLAETYGINAFKYKVLAFAIASFFAGIAGSFYAHYISFISPDLLWFYYLMIILITTIAGGLGTFYGVVLGAIIFTTIPEILRITYALREVIFGAILIATLYFLPEGIGGKLQDLYARFKHARGGGEER
jgi:branched-chain amino acid transport system permease protein